MSLLGKKKSTKLRGFAKLRPRNCTYVCQRFSTFSICELQSIPQTNSLNTTLSRYLYSTCSCPPATRLKKLTQFWVATHRLKTTVYTEKDIKIKGPLYYLFLTLCPLLPPTRSGPAHPGAPLPGHSGRCQGGGQDPADREHAGQGGRHDRGRRDGLHLPEGAEEHQYRQLAVRRRGCKDRGEAHEEGGGEESQVRSERKNISL